ncbi:MAG: UDP-N-acetylmuramoyl-L-alanyl-D-glutamate--2,6-diaminopimelate ligase [Candidatus Gottesmanbacteria bacterium]
MISWLKSLYHLIVAVGSSLYFRFPARHLTIIGITGTDGKTTTTTLVYEILKAAGFKTSVITSVHAVIAGKSYDTGFHVTTPNAFWVQKYLREAVDHGDTHVVLEVTSHALSQSRVWGIRFTVGILTNVTHEHLDFHKTYERYLMTKLQLLNSSDVAIINKDEGELYATISPLIRRKKMITYGIHRPATITPETYPFETKLPGEFNMYNCLAAIAAVDVLGISKETVKKAIKGFAGVPGRMEVAVTKPCRVIVDFAHTPNAIDKALKTVRDMTKGKVIHVFGSAGLRDRTKRPYMGKASAEYADVIVLTEEDYRTENNDTIMDEIASGIPVYKDVHKFSNRFEAITFALSDVKKDDTVIITGKGHEKSLCRGTVEYPWSDQDAVKKILKK